MPAASCQCVVKANAHSSCATPERVVTTSYRAKAWYTRDQQWRYATINNWAVVSVSRRTGAASDLLFKRCANVRMVEGQLPHSRGVGRPSLPVRS